jgi:hypothetical protein
MAHHLFDFEQACDEICAANSVPAAVLVEASPGGLLRSRPVDQQLVKNYIEKDFKVNQEEDSIRSVLTCKQEESTVPPSVESPGSTIKML